MANLSISVTSTRGQISWSIQSLGGAWNTSNYKKAGFATSQASSSGSTSLSGILTSVSPPSSGSNTYTSTYYYSPSSNLSDDDAVTLYGYCQAANGKYYPAGSVTIVPVHLWMDSESMSYYYANVGGYSFKITSTSISATAFWVPKNTSITLSSIQPASGWSNLRWHYNNSEGYDYANTYTDSPDNNIGTTYGRFGYYEARTYTEPATRYTITLYRNNSSTDATSDTTQTESTTGSTKSAYLGTPSEYGWSKSGYTFLYWNTNRNGTGTTYYAGTRNFTSNTTLYAIWQQNSTRYSVVIYRNSSSSDATVDTILTESTTSSTKSAYLGTPSEYGWSKSGYSFTYWTTERSGGGTAYIGGRTQSFTGNTTLYAQWELIPTYQYSVTIYRNYGTTTYNTYYTSSGTSTTQTIELPSCPWSRSGYEFLGYNTYSDGTGVWYVEGDTYRLSRNMTLYAIWRESATRYTITLYRNSSSSDATSDTTVTESTTSSTKSAYLGYPSEYGWSKTGYTFLYWNTNRSGTGTTYYAGTRNFTGDTTLYAIWTIRTFTCGAQFASGCSGMGTITVSNGTTTAGSVSVDYGDSATWTASAASGYQFVGWYSNQAGTGTAVSSSTSYTVSSVTSDTTLYAKFQAISYTVQASKSGFGSAFTAVSPASGSTAAYGSTVSFSATLASGFDFDGWYNGTGANATKVSGNNPYSHTVSGAVTLYARAKVKWTYSHAPGTRNVSKEEWDRLQDFVHDRNGATFAYTATVDEPISKELYNATKSGIGSGTSVKKGQAITQTLMNELITNANNL